MFQNRSAAEDVGNALRKGGRILLVTGDNASVIWHGNCAAVALKKQETGMAVWWNVVTLEKVSEVVKSAIGLDQCATVLGQGYSGSLGGLLAAQS